MKVIVPTSWDDITLETYQFIRALDRADYKTDLGLSVAFIDIVCDIDSKELSITDFNTISKTIEFMSTDVKADIKKSINVYGDTYKWVADFNSLTVGEMLSIEQVIDMEELTYEMSLDVVCAILLRKEGEAFDSNLFAERRELFNTIPITEIKGMVNFFSNGGRCSIQNTKDFSITVKQKRKRKSRTNQILCRVTSGFRWLIS